MSPPRVLLCARADLLEKPGGDTRQILGLQRHLGPHAELSLGLSPDLREHDIAHVFNLSRPLEPALQAEAARRARVPVVCTTIFQDLREYNRHGRFGAGKRLFELLGRSDERLEAARALVNLTRAAPMDLPRGVPALGAALLDRRGCARRLQARLLASSQLLVFNSPLEEQTVRRCLDPPPSARAAHVPLGIDPDELSRVDRGAFCARFGLEPGFVLAVGRLEDLKNQLALVAALEDDPRTLVLVGAVNPLHRAYARAVARAAAHRGRTLILHRLERPLLLSAMACAAVHVLPSWFETAGLVSLEAAALGCPVVSTDRGYARAFLGEEAGYCDPASPASIRAAVQQALARGPSPALRERILASFTEARVAQAMAALYEQVAA